jgi:RND family efflux transporter MFP subunit
MNLKQLLTKLLPLVIVAAALLVAVALIKTRRTAGRGAAREASTLVRVMPAARSREQVRVVAMGTVMPAQEVVLQPEVSGRVVEQSPKLIPGGHFDAGEVIAQIDRRDYELAVEQQKANVARAEFELKLEEGRRTIAEREWELLDQDVRWSEAGRDLALRKPHMENATAALDAARSGLKRAELDLDRTVIRAPFNVLVQDEFIDVGQIVSPQTHLANLIGTDCFWVQVSVGVDRLGWIRFPGVERPEGSKARIVYETGIDGTIEREGHVVQLRGDLDPKGRMARILVAIDDPFSLESAVGGTDVLTENGKPPLLLGAYVRVEIEGTELEDVVAVPRTALRDGDRVWIMGQQERLVIRDIEVAWRLRDTVLVRNGIGEGERIVVGAISTPIPGMKLRVE